MVIRVGAVGDHRSGRSRARDDYNPLRAGLFIRTSLMRTVSPGLVMLLAAWMDAKGLASVPGFYRFPWPRRRRAGDAKPGR
jgi:hypothetical protein